MHVITHTDIPSQQLDPVEQEDTGLGNIEPLNDFAFAFSFIDTQQSWTPHPLTNLLDPVLDGTDLPFDRNGRHEGESSLEPVRRETPARVAMQAASSPFPRVPGNGIVDSPSLIFGETRGAWNVGYESAESSRRPMAPATVTEITMRHLNDRRGIQEDIGEDGTREEEDVRGEAPKRRFSFSCTGELIVIEHEDYFDR
jgi:hypothetical protein